MTRIDQFSLTTTPIEQFFNGKLLGSATGFVWKIDGRYFLVTNWHVVTCRIFPTRQYIKSHAGRPNTLRVRFNFAAQIFEKQQYDIKIRDDDDRPLWFVHPGRNVDIAVIPLTFTADLCVPKTSSGDDFGFGRFHNGRYAIVSPRARRCRSQEKADKFLAVNKIHRHRSATA